jgi:hypothetical protein
MAVKMTNGKILKTPKNGKGNSTTLKVGAGSKKPAPIKGKTS